jgi:hypothetical protein
MLKYSMKPSAPFQVEKVSETQQTPLVHIKYSPAGLEFIVKTNIMVGQSGQPPRRQHNRYAAERKAQKPALIASEPQLGSWLDYLFRGW